MHFQIDYFALIFSLILLIFIRNPLKEKVVYFSTIAPLQGKSSRIIHLPKWLFYGAFFLFLLAFCDPHFGHQIKKPLPPKDAIGIYLVLDKSRSMAEPAVGSRDKLTSLKEMSIPFIEGRKQDLLGLIAFARGAEMLVPLTFDHDDVLDQLSTIRFAADSTQDGTAIGYAIFKATQTFAATKEPKSRVIVLITDGLQNPNPEDRNNRYRSLGIEEAAEIASDHGVRLYLINVDPRMTFSEFAPHRNVMERAAKKTGGEFFLADNPDTLADVFRSINQLETTPVTLSGVYIRKLSFYPYLLMVGLGLFFIGLLLSATWLRRGP